METHQDDPLWYKDAIIYEVHVRAFRDSNGDGIGDFPGLISKLDYLQELGVTALWLLPFYPSPLRDDGYDIADYNAVNPSYGTIRDVRTLVKEAHKRGLRVITELVCNHTSDQHAWFQRARKARKGSPQRAFYVWSDTPERYQDARIIFKDFESSNWSWDPIAEQYFWHRFYTHQPDLNFDNPAVHQAITKAMDFWLEMGIDGLRLDAIPYLYEREGTNCENLPETHGFLKKLRGHVDERYPSRMLLAEANQWPEDSVAYFGDGDECHMSFHFPVMPRLYMAIYQEDRFPIIDILNHTPPIPESSQWALFLRNHDELTLEMVTDEERDYMYRVYAYDPQTRINLGIRRRLAPLLGNNRRRIELMNALLFALPGTPVLYYGDEIGMGDNPYLGDRNGVRTPMQWSPDRNAGFSDANPQRLYFPLITDPEYHYQTINVEAQRQNPASLYWWMKRLIALRKRYPAFGRGSIEFLHPENRKVLAFVRRHGDQTILVVANLSRFVQYVELDLSSLRGATPVEMFGQTRFPPIGDLPYLLTLGPHSFYWFVLEGAAVDVAGEAADDPTARIPSLSVPVHWETLVTQTGRSSLTEVLPAFMKERRWFGGKARTVRSCEVVEAIPMRADGGSVYLTLARLHYSEGADETYLLPLACAEGERAEHILREQPGSVVARLRHRDGRSGILYDATADPAFATALLATIAGRRHLRGQSGELLASTMPALRNMRRASDLTLESRVAGAEQSNSSIFYGDRFILKLFRQLHPGVNPDLEVGRYLAEQGFAHTAPAAGALEYQPFRGQSMSIGFMQSFVTNQGDAWSFTLDRLGEFYERAAASDAEPAAVSSTTESLLRQADERIPDAVGELIGPYLQSAELLGQRTAELHLSLAAGAGKPDFAPEPLSALYLRSLYQSMRGQTTQTFQLLRRRLDALPEEARARAGAVIERQPDVERRFEAIRSGKIDAVRIRTHGDYHLGQVLYTGSDFAIIDFEGEPARPLGERRLKRPALRDVAGMLRSYHYAAHAALRQYRGRGDIAPALAARLEGWARYWHHWVSVAYLRAYLTTAAGAPFLPPTERERLALLDVSLLEKAIYELSYELNNRPDWVSLPVEGVLQLLES
jgi:maltose alpha-D-glucosyltransferase/alpha-amylase